MVSYMGMCHLLGQVFSAFDFAVGYHFLMFFGIGLQRRARFLSETGLFFFFKSDHSHHALSGQVYMSICNLYVFVKSKFQGWDVKEQHSQPRGVNCIVVFLNLDIKYSHLSTALPQPRKYSAGDIKELFNQKYGKCKILFKQTFL